jgi:putative redox protein
MATSSVKYLGGLRTEAKHEKSGQVIITDAPTDNHGRGEAFSPTDLMCTSLANCMITVMGIVAEREKIDMSSVSADVTKIMGTEPRRVVEIQVRLDFRGKIYSEKEKKLLENTAKTCPVAKSLHPDLKQSIEFIWS